MTKKFNLSTHAICIRCKEVMNLSKNLECLKCRNRNICKVCSKSTRGISVLCGKHKYQSVAVRFLREEAIY